MFTTAIYPHSSTARAARTFAAGLLLLSLPTGCLA